MKRCQGCGVILQHENILVNGYTPNIENNYCMRCFKVKNYGETSAVNLDSTEYYQILKEISKTNDLVLYVVDILNIRENLDDMKEYLENDMILVLNKRDVLPKSVKPEKIVEYLKARYSFKDYVVVSANNSYQLDLLYQKIWKYKKGSDVYFVGETNAGKSSLINKMVGIYSSLDANLTISNMPETTLFKMRMKIAKNLTLIDTPGLVDHGNIIQHVKEEDYKLFNIKKEIKPKTYQINKGQSLLIGNFLRINYLEGDRNSFTFYIPNTIPIKKINSKRDDLNELTYQEHELKFHEDFVVYGLGFVKIVLNGKIGVYLNKDIKTFFRKNLI